MNKIEVSCDICGDAMKKQADVYACYPCKHMIWESELSNYAEHVEIKETEDATQRYQLQP